jgi:hypothetical protein
MNTHNKFYVQINRKFGCSVKKRRRGETSEDPPKNLLGK